MDQFKVQPLRSTRLRSSSAARVWRSRTHRSCTVTRSDTLCRPHSRQTRLHYQRAASTGYASSVGSSDHSTPSQQRRRVLKTWQVVYRKMKDLNFLFFYEFNFCVSQLSVCDFHSKCLLVSHLCVCTVFLLSRFNCLVFSMSGLLLVLVRCGHKSVQFRVVMLKVCYRVCMPVYWVTWKNRSDLVLRPNFGLRPNLHKFFKWQQAFGLRPKLIWTIRSDR